MLRNKKGIQKKGKHYCMQYNSKTKQNKTTSNNKAPNTQEPLWETGDRATELLKQLGVEPNTLIYKLVHIWFSHMRDLPLGWWFLLLRGLREGLDGYANSNTTFIILNSNSSLLCCLCQITSTSPLRILYQWHLLFQPHKSK